MAGTPKRRARREAAQADQIPDAIGEETPESAPTVSRATVPLRAPARARTHAHASGAPARGTGDYTGPAARSAADGLRAGALEDVARSLRPGTVLRVERTRPLWAAGWIEDYPIDRSGVPGLLEYLRDEHGGQLYRLSPLSPAGVPVADFVQPIAGAVRVRGRAVDRETFERGGKPAPLEHAPAPQQSQTDNASILRMVLDEARESRNQTMEAVREIAKESRGLADRIIEQREAPSRRTLAEELAQLEETQTAVRRVARSFGGSSGKPAQQQSSGPGEIRDKLKGRFAEMIMGKVINEMGAPRGAPRGAPPPRQLPQQQRPQQPPQQRPAAPPGDGIPDAL